MVVNEITFSISNNWNNDSPEIKLEICQEKIPAWIKVMKKDCLTDITLNKDNIYIKIIYFIYQIFIFTMQIKICNVLEVLL